MRKAALLFDVLIGLVGNGVPATIYCKSPELDVESYESYRLLTLFAEELPPNIVNFIITLFSYNFNTVRGFISIIIKLVLSFFSRYISIR